MRLMQIIENGVEIRLLYSNARADGSLWKNNLNLAVVCQTIAEFQFEGRKNFGARVSSC